MLFKHRLPAHLRRGCISSLPLFTLQAVRQHVIAPAGAGAQMAGFVIVQSVFPGFEVFGSFLLFASRDCFFLMSGALMVNLLPLGALMYSSRERCL